MNAQKGLKNITVAIDFSEHTRLLVASAENLAIKSGAGLQLVYVMEPWDQHGLTRLLSHDERVVKMVQSADAYTFGRMEELMVKLVKEIDPRVQVTTTMRQGHAPNVITAAALEHGSDMIATGVQGDMPHLFPKNLSTALALMTESPLPVMAIPHNVIIKRDHQDIKLLICDDLSQDSADAMHSAFSFATALSDSEVFHLHVTQLNPHMLDAAIEQASLRSQGSMDSGLDGNMVFALAERALQDKLRTRVPDDVELRKKYFPLLRQGTLDTFVTQIIQDQGIDLLVFGEHRSIHKDPFYLGAMPFTAMVNHQTPVVVFPQEEQQERWQKKVRKAVDDIDMAEAAV